MKPKLVILSFLMLTSIFCIAQSKEISIGIGLSYQNESRSRIYNNEEKNSNSPTVGTGITLIKDFDTGWGMKFGMDYIKRKYEMETPYNHCYFYKSGVCTDDIRAVKSYGYQTMELSFGIVRYIVSNDKWQSYLNINAVTAFDYKSFYNEEYSDANKATNEINLFSGSITCNIGFERKISERVVLNIEPFVRLVHNQREDQILYGTQKKWTSFDNFGLQLCVMHSL